MLTKYLQLVNSAVSQDIYFKYLDICNKYIEKN